MWIQPHESVHVLLAVLTRIRDSRSLDCTIGFASESDRFAPDVVVLDVSMPRMNGLEACRLIRKTAPMCEILMVTQHDSPQMMREAINAGAKGYVVKSNAARDLLAAVEAVSQHRSFKVQDHPPPDDSR